MDIPCTRSQLGIYLITIALTAIIATAGLVALFDYSPAIIPLHLLVLSTLGAIVYILITPLQLLPDQWRPLRIVVTSALLSGIYLTWLGLTTANYTSNLFWHNYYTRRLNDVLFSSIEHWLTVNHDFVYPAVLASALFVGSVFIAHTRIARSIDSYMQQQARHYRQQPVISVRHLGICLILIISIITLEQMTFDKKNPGIWSGEPLIGSKAVYGRKFTTTDPDILQKLGYTAKHSYPSEVTAESPDNVILIIVDSLRADHLPIYGYHRETTPFLSSLARHNKLKKAYQSFSTCSESFCGILSTLNSKEFRNIHPDNFKLQDVLSRAGYQSHFILSGEHDWYGLKEHYGKNVDTLFDAGEASIHPNGDDELINEGLARLELDERPAFLYFHLMSNHFSGIKHDSHRTFSTHDTTMEWRAMLAGDYPLDDVINSYDDAIIQSDSYIQQIYRFLEDRELLDNSLIIITSDHGEAMNEHGRIGHGNDLFRESISIPLLIHDSRQLNYPGLVHTLQIDIAPTILDRLGLPIPASWQGRSLMQPAVARGSFHQTNFSQNWFASIYFDGENTYKYLRRGLSEHLPESESLHLTDTDPDDSVNMLEHTNTELIKTIQSYFDNALLKSYQQ